MADSGPEPGHHQNMTPTSRLRQALAGENITAFAPLVWASLPEFVQSSAPAEWWNDTGFCQRALSDAAAVCEADAMLVPILHEHVRAAVRQMTGPPEDIAADIAELPCVLQSLDIVQRLVAIGRVGVVALMPTMAELEATLSGCEIEDVEDALSNVARASLSRGADAVAVRGGDADVRVALKRLSGVAQYFGTHALGITAGRSWAADNGLDIGLVSDARPWPDPSPHVVTSFDDLSLSTPAKLRVLVKQRQRLGGTDGNL